MGVNPGVLAKIPNLAIKPSRSPNNPQFTIGSFIPLLSPVTIPQVGAANENVFSVNLPGKITDLIFYFFLLK